MENLKFSGLKNVLKAFDDHAWQGSFNRDNWRIANGANDLWFELYYKDTPVVQCIAGELSSDFGLKFSEEEMLLGKILEVYDNLKVKKPNLTRRLNVTVQCLATYNSSIDVPSDLSFDKALEYAESHIDKIPLGTLDYVPDSDKLDVENCDFEDFNLEETLKNEPTQATKISLAQQIESASVRSSTTFIASVPQSKDIVPDSIQVTLTKDELSLLKESLDVMGDRLADRVGYSSGEKYWDLKEKLEGIESRSLMPPSPER